MDVEILAECSMKRFYFYRFNLQKVSVWETHKYQYITLIQNQGWWSHICLISI